MRKPIRTRLAAALAVVVALAPAVPATEISGSQVYLSQAEFERLQQQYQLDHRAGLDSIDRCDREAYKRILERLSNHKRYADASVLNATDLMQRMALRLSEIAAELRQFLPNLDSSTTEVVNFARGAIEGAATSALGGAAGPAWAGISALRDAAKRIDDTAKVNDIIDRMEAQYREILTTAISAHRWKRLTDLLTDYIEDLATREWPPCDEPAEDDDGGDDAVTTPGGGTFVEVVQDAGEWCHYTSSTRTIVRVPGGTSVPPGVPGTPTPPGTPTTPEPPSGPDGGPATTPGRTDDPGDDDPRDVPGTPTDPCARLAQLEKEYAQAQQNVGAIQAVGGDPSSAQERVEEIEEELFDLRRRCTTRDPGDEPTLDDPRDTEPPDDEPPGPPKITIYVKARTAVLQPSGAITQQPVAGQQVKLPLVGGPADTLPAPGADRIQTAHDADPVSGRTDENGNLRLDVPVDQADSFFDVFATPGEPLDLLLEGAAEGSKNLLFSGSSARAAIGALPPGLGALVSDVTPIGGATFVTLTYPETIGDVVDRLIGSLPPGVIVEVNFCRDKQGTPDDPHFHTSGSWGQGYDDQWALKRVGFDDAAPPAWDLVGETPQPVTVAVVDTGLDWHHLDFEWSQLWNNEDEIPDNGVDDDANGFVDDVIGWDFHARGNKPWDDDGHGTIVAGIIAAGADNATGIAGVNPHARVMVLRALNSFGHTRASYLARAIVYAADNGARVINLSVGGERTTQIEDAAIRYAHEKGSLVVVAAGNEGTLLENYGPAAHELALTVAATDVEDARTVFSNWGPQVDIAAPGMDVLSLRARLTDTMLHISEVEYEAGANYVGEDKRYYRASGTSFAAPFVAGAASLVLSARPELGPDDVRRVLLNSARDIDTPGVDQYSGYGLLDVRAALRADPGFYVVASLAGVEVVQTAAGTAVRVLGTASADRFGSARVELGAGEEPESWTTVIESVDAAVEGALGDVPAERFRGSPVWTLRLIVRHADGTEREARFQLSLG